MDLLKMYFLLKMEWGYSIAMLVYQRVPQKDPKGKLSSFQLSVLRAQKLAVKKNKLRG